MRFPVQSWDHSLYVPVTLHTEKFVANSSIGDDKALYVQAFNNPTLLMSGEIDLDSFEITTCIEGRIQKFKPTRDNLSFTFQCPMDPRSQTDCIRASAEWVSHDHKDYRIKMITEVPITEVVNWVALGLHSLQAKHWSNCFALNTLKSINLVFDRSLNGFQRIGNFKIERPDSLEIEPIYPLPIEKKSDLKSNPNLLLSSLVQATYMQKHPQEYLYARTNYKIGTDLTTINPKNKSIIKYPNGAKVTEYL